MTPARKDALQWVRTEHKLPDQVGYHAAGYSIWTGKHEGAAVLTSSAPYYIGPFHVGTVKEARDMAETDAGRRALEAGK